MNILVAPDSFKGSLSAAKFCRIAKEVIESRLTGARVVALPMADGGEGTVEALVAGTGGKIRRKKVKGPLGDTVVAMYGFLGDEKTAVVEMAAASGLPLVPEERRNPLNATSFGTGELIADALDQGVEHVILGLGGSATNDCGAGALQALDGRFLDEDGVEFPSGLSGGELTRVAAVDTSGLDEKFRKVSLHVGSDVTNPLLGRNGATMTYGPQKGATAGQLEQLEAGMAHFAEITVATTALDHRSTPGSGAAGGMGFGFLSYCGAELKSGFELVAERYGIEKLLKNERFSLIITGEGELDSQSVQGKLVGRLAQLGKSFGVPVVAFAGGISGDVSALYDKGVISMSSIVPRPLSLEEAMDNAESLLGSKLYDFCELVKATPRFSIK